MPIKRSAGLHQAPTKPRLTRVRPRLYPRHGPHAHQHKLTRTFKGWANNLLPFRAQKADAGRRAHHRNGTRNFPRLSHGAQKHGRKRRSCQHQQPRRGRCPHLPGGAKLRYSLRMKEPVELRSTGQMRTSAPPRLVVVGGSPLRRMRIMRGAVLDQGPGTCHG